MTLQKDLQFFIKELSKNKSKITKVFFTIFISLLIFSSVTILRNSIENQINDNSKVFLGGDLELSTKNKALDLNFLNELKESFLVAKVFEFTSIIRTISEESKTTRIKVIDDFYPLVGNVIVEPADSLKTLKTKPNTILIDKIIQQNLDLKIGERIKIQNISFEVIGTIKSLPDIGGFFLFGDQALISESSYKNLKINNLGSFISFKYKLLKKNNDEKTPKYFNEYENLEIKYPEGCKSKFKKGY